MAWNSDLVRACFVPCEKKACTCDEHLLGSKILKGAFGRTNIPFHATLTALLCLALTFSPPQSPSYCACTQLSTPFCYLCLSGGRQQPINLPRERQKKRRNMCASCSSRHTILPNIIHFQQNMRIALPLGSIFQEMLCRNQSSSRCAHVCFL
jgi:hypothetical protein